MSRLMCRGIPPAIQIHERLAHHEPVISPPLSFFAPSRLVNGAKPQVLILDPVMENVSVFQIRSHPSPDVTFDHCPVAARVRQSAGLEHVREADVNLPFPSPRHGYPHENGQGSHIPGHRNTRTVPSPVKLPTSCSCHVFNAPSFVLSWRSVMAFA